MAAFDFTILVVALPVLAFLVSLVAALLDVDVLPMDGAGPGIAATAGSLALSVWLAVAVAGGGRFERSVHTFAAGGPDAPTLSVGVLVDPLAALMLIVVSGVSLLVNVFSLGYMNAEGEVGLPRYYAGLALFTASMLAFVLSNNLFTSFVFFELVGLCSYLLIGFHFREPGPPSAAKKAFLVTRFGDYFFLVGLVGMLVTFGTADFVDGFPTLAERVVLGEVSADAAGVTTFGFAPRTWFSVLGLLVLGGAIGKSAQFPLHTWLPDAMEGPTPVSALIHAATMVAAGVYLIARIYGFYALLPTVLAVIALTGGVTALFAATMGVVKDEIKQVLAYSTISQYGYMMLALGAGGYVAGVFHLATHAAFKALLFLGAGAVIVAMHHEEDMWEMGGLRDALPVTYYTFLAGSLALAGIVPFAGFWSKDEVLYEALVHGLGGSPLLLAGYATGLLAVPVTGFYTFRMVRLTFHGEARSETARNPHGVGWSMKGPLAVLGLLALVGGALNPVPVAKLTGLEVDFLHAWLAHGDGAFAALTADHYGTVLHDAAGYAAADLGPLAPAAVSLALALAGSAAAWRLYATPDRHTRRLGRVRTLLANNYYQDEYQVWLATGFVQPLARVADKFDRGVVDGAVNAVSSVSLATGRRLRRLQTGTVSTYAAFVTLGLTALVLFVALVGGWFS